MTPDVNVLVAASRSDHPHHVPALYWLSQSADRSSVTLLPVVATGFVRIVTNRRIFPVPTPTEQAFAFVDSLTRGGVHMLTQGGEWKAVRALCEKYGLRGGDVTDAWIAASVLHHDEQLATFDKGFRRFLSPEHLMLLTAAQQV